MRNPTVLGRFFACATPWQLGSVKLFGGIQSGFGRLPEHRGTFKLETQVVTLSPTLLDAPR